jgi:hypothetical protein
MPQRSWPGSLITKTPVTPAGPYQEGAASGVWTLEEALQWTGKDLWPLGGNTFTPLIFIGGFSTSNTTKIQQVNPASTGDAENCADLSAAVYYSAGCGNSTRAVWSPMTGDTNRIEYIDYATGGTSSTFGDVVQSDSEECAALSNSTRACFASGAATAAEDVICYITISSTGNATDFGDLTIARDKLVGMASATRGLFCGGEASGNPSTRVDYITIASTGNATDFGGGIYSYSAMGGANGTTAIYGGGSDNGDSSAVNVIEERAIASTGDFSDFGDLSQGLYQGAASSSSTRVLFGGGFNTSSAKVDEIQYVTIASAGNAVDFGNLTAAMRNLAAASSVQGNL